MKFLNSKFVSILWVIGGVAFLVPVLKHIIKGEPLAGPSLAIACMYFTFAIICGHAARKSTDNSNPPNA